MEKLSINQASYAPNLTYAHELLVTNKSEANILQRKAELTTKDRGRSSDIQEELLFHTERSRIRCPETSGHDQFQTTSKGSDVSVRLDGNLVQIQALLEKTSWTGRSGIDAL